MIATIRGKIISKKPDSIIVDVGGVGYLVYVPLNLFSSIKDINGEVFLYIYTYVREDALSLFGFLTEEEKKIFTTLIGIPGIGPKIALSILSTISLDDFEKALWNEDIAFLCRVPGLGKKTAQRLILELREKLPTISREDRDPLFDDTLSALVNLGYKKSVAQEALEEVYSKGIRGIEGLIKEALKVLTKTE
ncbi:MAG: Holliday junction branch migration protein RuvA [Thermodesulfovibrionales bacterium]|nr:Holliday junction branch migration protein RuvA [Thermodesulfovibrionales bacterium]